ncbi:helix-turn-helix domain-containing protein [bacterium]|nr:helix-turn-helix domain-containing protein [bacterium]
MKNYLGEIIYNSRQKENLTQDQYGARYSVSGPAIFKFEKGYVKPSLDLWLKMAADAGLSERRSVLLWVKSKLPDEYQEYIELQSAAVAESEAEYAKKKGKKPDYSKFETREQMRDQTEKDKSIPKGLKELLDDDELWALYKPTGHEINLMRDLFGPLGRGSKTAYREALRLIREFAHSF